jgi:endonuclease V-like protein UPF0215 family
MPAKRFSNLIGFDDAPFPRGHRGRVGLVGAVFAGPRFDGVVVGEIVKDGADAADEVIHLVAGSRFAEHVQLILLQGVAFGGFNVVDAFKVNEELGLPAMIVARRRPNMAAIRRALLGPVPGGSRKWEIIERLGEMEPLGGVYVQRVGITVAQAASVIERFALHGQIPEPLRVAHLIAGGLATGESRGRV